MQKDNTCIYLDYELCSLDQFFCPGYNSYPLVEIYENGVIVAYLGLLGRLSFNTTGTISLNISILRHDQGK